MLVGVGRVFVQCAPQCGSCPHARGGGPSIVALTKEIDLVVPMLVGVGRESCEALRLTQLLSPCSWGWAAYRQIHFRFATVVPMLVGVGRRIPLISIANLSCPHARAAILNSKSDGAESLC